MYSNSNVHVDWISKLYGRKRQSIFIRFALSMACLRPQEEKQERKQANYATICNLRRDGRPSAKKWNLY